MEGVQSLLDCRLRFVEPLAYKVSVICHNINCPLSKLCLWILVSYRLAFAFADARSLLRVLFKGKASSDRIFLTIIVRRLRYDLSLRQTSCV